MNFDFDNALANDLINSILLVGITYLDPEGEFESQTQFYGRVTSADPQAGIRLELQGIYQGSDYNLPPDTSCIWRAEPGVYTLSESKDVVENPDFLCTWEVHRKADENET